MKTGPGAKFEYDKRSKLLPLNSLNHRFNASTRDDNGDDKDDKTDIVDVADDSIHSLVAPWCSDFHYCTTSFNFIRKFKPCSLRVGDSQW